MKIINAKKAPQAIGPYSHAVLLGDLLFTSGNLPIDPKTNKLVEGIEDQTRQVIENIEVVLASAGFTMEDIVKTTCFLINMDDFEKFNRVYAKHIKHKPARTSVAVKEIPGKALCEIEVIAYKQQDKI